MSEVKFFPKDGTISLEAARVNVGLTLEQASKELGVTVPTLINYEKGRTSPTLEMAKKMCVLYNANLSKVSFLPK